MSRFFLFLALLASVAGQCNVSVNCFNGECFDDMCFCASGAYGSQCALVAPNSCVYANLSNLATDNYPVLDTALSELVGDNLHLFVYAPLVNNRLASGVYLGDSNNVTMYPHCLSTSQYWSKSIESTANGCREVYEANIPWAVASQCGWATDSNAQPGHVIWKNHIYVRHDDQLSIFRGVPVKRDTVHTFPIKIDFQLTVDVSTNLNVFAPVNLLAAVTVQTFDPSVKQGDISILTSLQWPFRLDSVSIAGLPANINASVSSSNLDCPPAANSACTQLYTISIDPLQACTLSGSYQLQFVLTCRSSPSECPLDANTNSATITASINSENFCNGVDLDVGLTGSMEVYDSNSYTVVKHNFLYDQQAFFRATLVADGSVSIVSSVIEQVRVDNGNGNVIFPYDNGVSEVVQIAFALDNASPVLNPSFLFTPNDQYLPAPIDSSASYTVFARIRVGYAGGVQRRSMIAARQIAPGETAGEYSTAITMENPSSSLPSVSSDSSISSVDDGLSGSAATLAATALMLAF